MVKIKQVWQNWIPKPQQLEKAGDIIESGAEVSNAVLEFAIALGVLASVPSAPVVAAALPFVGIARKGLALLREKTNQKFEIEQWVAIAYPLAYVNSFGALVQKNLWLQEKLNLQATDQEVKPQFNQLGEVELNNGEAKEAIKNFPTSVLGQALNQQLCNYLETKGISSEIAPLVAGWVAWDTYNHIKELLSYEPENVHQALSLIITAGQQIRANDKYTDIELYLKEKISPSPSDPILIDRWKVIGEEFKIPEIYVSLEAQLLDSNGRSKEKESAVNLEHWMREQLNKDEKNRQVIFIQAWPGRGKSVFCKMFADSIREQLHPIWTPILIRLRDIDTFEPNIENTLRAAVRENFANRDDWLSDRSTRYLFILDGFDELRFEGRTAKGIEDFLGQVGNYQAHTGCRHQFLVTGRESALYGIENRLPTNLIRLEISLMNDSLQNEWLEKWSKLFGQDTADNFQDFIRKSNCPYRVKELAREPLLLYLLAVMHRDNELNISMFEGADEAKAKIIIYQKTLDWVLTKQRPERLNQELTEFDTEDLRLILTEAGLCVTQSGREWASITTIEERIKNDKSARDMLERAKHNLGENPLKNACGAFYLRPAKASDSAEGAMEFIHKSFGEFLCAQRIIESLKKWVRLDPGSRRERFVIDDEQLSEEIYDLFNYGGLSLEIVEYLMPLLDLEEKFNYIKLFERLEDFYIHWCTGDFINGCPKNIPLNQMQKFQKQSIILDLREVDIYAGLNVMILLLELHNYAQDKDELKDKIFFYPCGENNSDNFDEMQLLRIIKYSDSVNVGTFSMIVGEFLSGAYLRNACLSCAILSVVDLSEADLIGASLLGTDLEGVSLDYAKLTDASLPNAHLYNASLTYAIFSDANLAGADLTNAELTGANLEGANLRRVNLNEAELYSANLVGADLLGADLTNAILDDADLSEANLTSANLTYSYFNGANLSNANLTRANLNGADLSGANFNGADLTGSELIDVTWDEHTNWTDVRGLDKALNVSESLLSAVKSSAQPSETPNIQPST
ncbi:MAG TPA: pentapeptide repeat-containing protein [Leptolyngbyaceae cyanobacterium]